MVSVKRLCSCQKVIIYTKNIRGPLDGKTTLLLYDVLTNGDKNHIYFEVTQSNILVKFEIWMLPIQEVIKKTLKTVMFLKPSIT